MKTNEPCPSCGLPAVCEHGALVNGRAAHTWICPDCGETTAFIGDDCPVCTAERWRTRAERAEAMIRVATTALDPEAESLTAALGGDEAALVTRRAADRKSTRLNSSHLGISYAVFCLKKKKKT